MLTLRRRGFGRPIRRIGRLIGRAHVLGLERDPVFISDKTVANIVVIDSVTVVLKYGSNMCELHGG